jgi:hypothetical protein
MCVLALWRASFFMDRKRWLLQEGTPLLGTLVIIHTSSEDKSGAKVASTCGYKTWRSKPDLRGIFSQ